MMMIVKVVRRKRGSESEMATKQERTGEAFANQNQEKKKEKPEIKAVKSNRREGEDARNVLESVIRPHKSTKVTRIEAKKKSSEGVWRRL
jgi:PleD family two-component response regulator